jgi:hypothetical protein
MTDEVVVPRWQPDYELSACSICGNAFTFLTRRHHCRRCGRLVCGPCSPHRITIPRQYIVHPPEEEPLNPDGNTRSRSNTGSSDGHENPALGGGETVRVCNPCVPDPNYGPPPQQQEEQRSPPPSTPSSRSRAQTFAANEGTTSSISFARMFGSLNVSDLGQATCQSVPHNARTLSDFGATPPQPTERRGSYRPQLHTARYQALNSVPQRPRSSTQGLRTRSDNDTVHLSRSRYRSASHTPSSIAAAQVAQTQMQQPQGREALSEEDECPVCGTRNHPFGTSGTSEEREQHVEFCISSHLAGPSHGATTVETSNQTGTGSSETVPVGSIPQRVSSMLGASTARQRMLVYHATEKDCFDEDGQAQECVICFEEFEEGAEMGRLECLCKFHRACIKEWWQTRGRGTCPTHQLHD